jgi:hypothetical protein
MGIALMIIFHFVSQQTIYPEFEGRLNLMGRRFSQMNSDNLFLSPIRKIRIHPPQKAISCAMK